jgi:hypothetical protein
MPCLSPSGPYEQQLAESAGTDYEAACHELMTFCRGTLNAHLELVRFALALAEANRGLRDLERLCHQLIQSVGQSICPEVLYKGEARKLMDAFVASFLTGLGKTDPGSSPPGPTQGPTDPAG